MTSATQYRTSLFRILRPFFRNQDGTTAIEYALIGGGIGLAIAVTVPGVGTALNDFFTTISGSF